MKELMMAVDLYPVVVDNVKKITIRQGIRDFDPGDDLKIINVDQPKQFVLREVSEVYKFRQADMVPRRLLRADGFTSSDNFFESMQRFYPEFDALTPVTVICWD